MLFKFILHHAQFARVLIRLWAPEQGGGLLQVPIRTEMVLSLHYFSHFSFTPPREFFLLSLIQKKVTLRFDTTHRCRYVLAAFDLNGNMLSDCLVEHDPSSLTERE